MVLVSLTRLSSGGDYKQRLNGSHSESTSDHVENHRDSHIMRIIIIGLCMYNNYSHTMNRDRTITLALACAGARARSSTHACMTQARLL